MSTDSTIFDSKTENTYLDGTLAEAVSINTASMQWVMATMENEYDDNEKLVRSVHTTYAVPDIPLWDALPQLLDDGADSEKNTKMPDMTPEELIDRNKIFYKLLKNALVRAGLRKVVKDGVTDEIAYKFFDELNKHGLVMRIIHA